MKSNGPVFSIELVAAVPPAPPALAAQVVGVEVTNLTNGIYFTPLLVTAHGRDTDLFEPGRGASDSLRTMAECGDISGLLADLAIEDTDTLANSAGGLLPSGGTASDVSNVTATRHRFTSLVTMLLPTNDGFVGLNSMPVPLRPGRHAMYLCAYDAGTEVNEEIPAIWTVRSTGG